MAENMLPIISRVSATVEDLSAHIVAHPGGISLNKSFKLDCGAGDLELSGGNIAFVSEEENLRQWISKTLATAMGYYVVYGHDYGSMVVNWLGVSESTDMIELLTPTVIRETLLMDNRIIDIDRIIITRRSDYISASFRVMTVNYDYFSEENVWAVL